MCGIVGFVTTKNNAGKYDQVLKELLMWDTVRGRQSTGLALIKDGKTNLYKKAMSGPDFVESRGFENLMRINHGNVVALGHNRAATIGDVSDKNAHPFDTGKIVLVHNGTIRNYHQLNSGATSPVDSEHVAYSMDKNGERETLEKIDGPGVFVWFNYEKNTFNIAKTTGRDIHWTYDKDGTLLFASEWEMLYAICTRYNIQIEQFQYPPENYHAVWDLKDISNFTGEKFPPFFTKAGAGKATGSTAKDKRWAKGAATPHTTGGKEICELTSRKTIKRVSKRLKTKYGLKLGEHIRLHPHAWSPVGHVVGGNALGSMIAAFEDDYNKNDWAKLLNIPLHVFQKHTGKLRTTDKDYWFEAVVINLWDDPRSGNEYVICKLANPPEEEKKEEKKEEEYSSKEYIYGPKMELIPVSEYKSLTAAGCKVCRSKITVSDAPGLDWVDGPKGDPEPVCVVCSPIDRTGT